MSTYGLDDAPGHSTNVTPPAANSTGYSSRYYKFECSCGGWEGSYTLTASTGKVGTRAVRSWKEHLEVCNIDPNTEILIGTINKTRVQTKVKVITTFHPSFALAASKSRGSTYYRKRRSWAWIKETYTRTKTGGAITISRGCKYNLGGISQSRDEAISKAKQFIGNEESGGAAVAIEDVGGVQIVSVDFVDGLSQLLVQSDTVDLTDLDAILNWRHKAKEVLDLFDLIAAKDAEMGVAFKEALKFA